MLRRYFAVPSLTRRRWAWRDADDRAGLAIAQALDLPEIVGRLLAARGLDARGAADYLAPTLRAAMPDPSVLLDMDVAAERLARAVLRRETVGVFGDYDVDGACAASLLATALRALGCAVVTHIPDRVREGYGPNGPALAGLVKRGATLLVCVDCGTAAGDVLSAVTGAEVVVLDHHKSDVPPVGIVGTVNPNRLDDRSGLGLLCAAAIVFLALVATHRVLRRRGHFSVAPEPDLLGLLDIVALATVCDVVPLEGLNRALVTQGLRVLARRARPGLAALLDVAGVRQAPGAFALGYALGPRMNAGGRIGDPALGLRLLLTEDEAEAARIAAELDAVNRDRQQVETAMFERAATEAGEQLGRGHASVLIESPDWHPGVVGIVAGRLARRFNRPVCVGARGAELTKGSGRSIAGLDLGAAVIAARACGLLMTGGGHAMAAGYGHAPAVHAALHAFLDERLAGAREEPEQPDLLVDGTLSVAAASPELARQVERLAPFGQGNPEPAFVLEGARVVRADRFGEDGRVLRTVLQGEAGTGRVKAVLFRAGESPLAAVLGTPGPPLRLAGHLRVDRFRGAESVCFAIEDAAMMG